MRQNADPALDEVGQQRAGRLRYRGSENRPIRAHTRIEGVIGAFVAWARLWPKGAIDRQLSNKVEQSLLDGPAWRSIASLQPCLQMSATSLSTIGPSACSDPGRELHTRRSAGGLAQPVARTVDLISVRPPSAMSWRSGASWASSPPRIPPRVACPRIRVIGFLSTPCCGCMPLDANSVRRVSTPAG